MTRRQGKHYIACEGMCSVFFLRGHCDEGWIKQKENYMLLKVNTEIAKFEG